jgi:DNA-binding Lrp family transcriptional regulator
VGSGEVNFQLCSLGLHSFSPSFRSRAPANPKFGDKKMVHDNDYEALVSLGLSALEARVYLAFIEHGSTTLATIAKQLNLSHFDLYRAILKLEELGLIKNPVIEPERFEPDLMNGFTAASVMPAVDGNLLEKIPFDSFWRLRKKALNRKILRVDSQCYLFSDSDLCGYALKKIVETANVSYDCIVPANAFKHNLRFMVDVFVKAVGRGVRFRHILIRASRSAAFKIDAPLGKSPFFEISWVNDCSLEGLIIVDDSETFILAEAYEAGQVSFLWSMVPSIVEIGRGYFSRHLRRC